MAGGELLTPKDKTEVRFFPRALNMGKLFYYFIGKNNKKISFNILVYFLFTFIAVRLLVYAFTYDIISPLTLFIKGIHIHHFNFGIFILAFVGYWALTSSKDTYKLKVAKFYGIGLALTFDEFGLWLFLQDNYWVRQSYDAIIVILAIFLNIIYAGPLWQRIIDKNTNFWKKAWYGFLKKI